MKFVAVIIFVFIAALSHAQNLTGVWRGYFYSGVGMFQQRYKYEVQINQLPNQALRGVTYSYHTTLFYGKADLKGILRATEKSLIVKEDSMLEMKAGFGTSACLMTCYLDYSKDDTLETLQGTFSSISVLDNKDCGGGTVYLQRVKESDFKKEDFLLRKNVKPAPPVVKKTTPLLRPAKPYVRPAPKKDSALVLAPPIKIPSAQDTLSQQQLPPLPPQLKLRENKLVKTIITSSPYIKVDLYDNGEIDGDTVTLYHNNEVAAFKKGLSGKAITLDVKATAADNRHEFVMYADNLGKIPPNTALMVVTTGGKRYEVALTSTEQKNAKVMIEYQP